MSKLTLFAAEQLLATNIEEIVRLRAELRETHAELASKEEGLAYCSKSYGDVLRQLINAEAELTAISALAQAKQLRMHECAYCGYQYPLESTLTEHIKSCPKHPLAGVKRQLARREVQVASIREAIAWLWGYYDGNTLIAKPEYEVDIRDAWDKLLVSVESPAATKLPERLATLDAAEAALAGCGITGIYDQFNSPADAIEQMVKRLVQLEGGQALQVEYQLRWEAKTAVDKALLLAEAPSTFDDGTPMDVFTRILWLKEKVDTLKAERRNLQHSLDGQLKTTHAERDKRRRAEGLAALVTEVPRALDKLADAALTWNLDADNNYVKRARALAERIREALVLEANDD